MAQWWICPPDGQVVIDDASISGIDCSPIPSDVYLVFWHGDGGEIMRTQSSVMPVRSKFVDPTPYIPIFNRWISAAQYESPPITLSQTKGIKIDLVNSLYNMKRQLPISTPSGTYNATDTAMLTMVGSLTTTALLNAINLVITDFNNRIAAFNSALASYDAAIRGDVTAFNSAITAYDVQVKNGIATFNGQPFNTDIVNDLSNYAAQVVSLIVTQANSAIATLNIAYVDAINAAIESTIPLTGGDTWNAKMPHQTLPTEGAPGFPAYPQLALLGYPSGPYPQLAYPPAPYPSLLPMVAVSVAGDPTGQAVNAISARTTNLNSIQVTKINQIMALTTIDQVAAYDVTSGW